MPLFSGSFFDVDVDCGTIQMTDLILNWLQTNFASPLDVILSQGLTEVSLPCVK